jgi:hypothetical protein
MVLSIIGSDAGKHDDRVLALGSQLPLWLSRDAWTPIIPAPSLGASQPSFSTGGLTIPILGSIHYFRFADGVFFSKLIPSEN